MEKDNLMEIIEKGKIEYLDKSIDVNKLIWNDHPSYAGVSLKHLISGQETEGRFSCHLVRVDARHEIGEHIHEDKWELHEVIYGSGKCIMLDKEIPYQPGTAALIPAGIKHRVIAEQGTLYLLAKFVPAL